MPRRSPSPDPGQVLVALFIQLPLALIALGLALASWAILTSLRLLEALAKLGRFVFRLLGSLAKLVIRPRRSPAVLLWRSPAYVRRPIPSEVKQKVWARDGGRCVLCGSRYDLHYDHDIPVSKGGANTVQNLRLLCATCNLRKGAKIE